MTQEKKKQPFLRLIHFQISLEVNLDLLSMFKIYSFLQDSSRVCGRKAGSGFEEAEGLWGAVEMQMTQITRNMCAKGTTFLVLKGPGTATEVEWF